MFEKAWVDARDSKQMDRGWIKALDALRQDDPSKVVELAKEALTKVQKYDRPYLLGVYASALRAQGQLKAARTNLTAGIQVTRDRRDYSATGDLLQRLSLVFGDQGAYEKALQITSEATIEHLHVPDMPAVGRTLVDRGVFLYYLNRYSSAIDSLNAALELLPPSENRNIFAAFQVSALCYRELGAFDIAVSFCDKAKARASGLGKASRGRLLWLESELLRDAGLLTQAAVSFGEVYNTFCELGQPLDIALVVCDYVAVLLDTGKKVAAFEICFQTKKLLAPLKDNRLARSAIFELIRAAQQGLLENSQVNAVKEKIKRAQEKKPVPSRI